MIRRCSAVTAISLIRWLDTSTVRPSAPTLQQGPDPQHPVRVQTVDRLVEDQRARVAQQRHGDPQTLRHAQRVAADPPVRHLGQAGRGQDLGDPAVPDPVRLREGAQVALGAAALVQRLGVQQRTDQMQRCRMVAVAGAADRDPCRTSAGPNR